MATVAYSNYTESRNKSTAPKKDFKVGYFNSLKDDKDTAIVRFAYASADDFKLQTVHVIKVGNAFKRVACLRDSLDDPKEKCPLCASGDKFKTKLYVELLEYVTDENGRVVPMAKVWERPAKFHENIMNAYNTAIEMGVYPVNSKISDVVFKITRNGAKGDKETDYTVTPVNPAIYKEDIYVKKFDDFKDLDLAHHSYWEKSAADIQVYLDTGDFPAKVGNKIPWNKADDDDDTTPVKPAAKPVVNSIQDWNGEDTPAPAPKPAPAPEAPTAPKRNWVF